MNNEKNQFHRQKGNQVKIVQTKTFTNNEVVDSIVNQLPSDSDPNGSYTGRPLDENETPVQDADDL